MDLARALFFWDFKCSTKKRFFPFPQEFRLIRLIPLIQLDTKKGPEISGPFFTVLKAGIEPALALRRTGF